MLWFRHASTKTLVSSSHNNNRLLSSSARRWKELNGLKTSISNHRLKCIMPFVSSEASSIASYQHHRYTTATTATTASNVSTANTDITTNTTNTSIYFSSTASRRRIISNSNPNPNSNSNQSRPYSNSTTHNNTTNKTNKTGLFSLPNLHQPSDFLTLAANAITTCNDLRQQVRNSLPSKEQNQSQSTTLSPRETLYLLDDISNTVCSVIDASELCRSVHTSPKWREAAANAFQLLSEYIAELNADEALYQSLIPITSNSSIMNTLDEEECRMALLLQKEFERDGIHLSKEKRDDVQQLSGFVTQLETMFSTNLVSSSNHSTYDLEGDLVDDVTQIIPRHVLMDATAQSQGQGHGQGQYNNNQNQPEYNSLFRESSSSSSSSSSKLTMSTEPHITNTILRHSPSPELRRVAYMESNTNCKQNLDVLDALIKQRHELATTMGYQSYAHYFTSDKMAGNPNHVYTFLNNVSVACNDRFKYEMELLRNAKKHVEGSSGIDTNADTDGSLHAWDMNFYNGLVKAHMFEEDDSSSSSLNGYFTVDQSLEGMKVLVKRLFGIIMEEVRTKPEEQWDYNNDDDTNNRVSSSSSSSSSLIRKFEFYKEEDGSGLGTIYYDLHPREGKYAHAAHFTIQCGCESRDGDGSQYQLPIVAVVCNLSPPFANPGNSSTSTSTSTSASTAILSHSEVETLYHEFGHALHSLLSRTKFQHLSGTRAAMDFVETPSHLMEYFVWNKEFLNIIGKHYITGETIPQGSIDKLIKSRNLFKAIDIQTQVVYGLFDQTMFGPPELWRGVDGTTTTTDVFAALHREHNVPYMDGTHWHSKFGHLVTYGAGYYSYLYASIFSADLWNTCFDGGGKAFNSDVGMSYWNEVLIHGGAKDPNLMLRAMLGRDPKAEGFFKF